MILVLLGSAAFWMWFPHNLLRRWQGPAETWKISVGDRIIAVMSRLLRVFDRR